MSPNTAKKKCKNFLSTLIRLADEQPAAVAKSVRNLIQGIIVSYDFFLPFFMSWVILATVYFPYGNYTVQTNLFF